MTDRKHITYGELTGSLGNNSAQCRHKVFRLERAGEPPEVIVKGEAGAFSMQAYLTPNEARAYACWLIEAAGAADAFAALPADVDAAFDERPVEIGGAK